jgi:nucleoside-diphosphate-sugar epimerase
MESDESVGRIINIGAGNPVTICDLANLVIDCSDQKGKIKPEFAENKRIDIKHRSPEISKMIKLLGFHPAVSLETGLKKTINYYKNIN